jgi:hypothetical protein
MILIPKTAVVAGIPKLRRVLLAYSLHNPEVEYCQVPYTNLIILYSEPLHVIELVKEKKRVECGWSSILNNLLHPFYFCGDSEL